MINIEKDRVSTLQPSYTIITLTNQESRQTLGTEDTPDNINSNSCCFCYPICGCKIFYESPSLDNRYTICPYTSQIINNYCTTYTDDGIETQRNIDGITLDNPANYSNTDSTIKHGNILAYKTGTILTETPLPSHVVDIVFIPCTIIADIITMVPRAIISLFSNCCCKE